MGASPFLSNSINPAHAFVTSTWIKNSLLNFLNVLFPSDNVVYKMPEANVWSSELFNIKIFPVEI